jgi:hypothetical protein
MQKKLDKKKTEAIIKRSELELIRNKKELESHDLAIRTLEEKIHLKGELTKTLKSTKTYFN